ncbi:MAG: serine protease [Natrialbaceae archaeon]|jgi:serine protease
MADDHTGPWGRREFLQATGAAGAFAAFGGVTAADSDRELGAKEDELLLGVSSSTQMSTAQTRVERFLPSEARVRKRNKDLGYMAVRMPDRASAQADSSVAETLKQVPGVKYVEENATHEALMTPDDPKFDEQYAPQLVNAPAAWDTTLGSEDVTIAIVDQGVKYDHPDLEAQFGSNKGKDFVDNDGDPMPDADKEMHGTHVAGIASATTDDGTGVAGMSNSRLLSGRSLSEEGSGSTDDIADAVQWAADQGADIINMSLGGGGYTETMKNAVSYALNNGALPICAAGNDGSEGVSYPAKYDECIAVGAIDSNEDLTDFSQYGENLDVVAPGQDVLSSSTRNGGYEKLPGTSMACPAVSGVAALGLAAHSEWSASDLRAKLKETAVDIGLSDNKQGSGKVDADALVGGVTGPTAKFAMTPTDPEVGETIEFDASASTGENLSYSWSGFVSGTGKVVSKTIQEGGTYDVTLTVDGANGTDSITKTFSTTSNTPPEAKFIVSPTEPKEGEEVTFDGSGSSDPDGTISSYEWSGAVSGSGESLTTTFSEAGDYDVTLTVTDDDGASNSATKTVTVVKDGGQCGDEKTTASGSGYLYGYWDDASFTYTSALSSPCQLTISLDGPYYDDFDLYVTTDGSTPSTWNYDKRSVTQDSQEQIIIDNIEPGQDFGILVDSYEGSGNFTVTVEELGK